MKQFFSLTTFLLLMSSLLYQSTSFTTAEIKNEATLSIVPEENALIAINYGEGELFAVTNNTANAIRIESRGTINVKGTDSSEIEPGRTNGFTFSGEPEDLSDGIHLIAQWDGGSAEIQSMIPESNIAQILLELDAVEVVLELDAEEVAPKLNEKLVISEINEEQVAPEINEESVAPKINEEPATTEIIEAEEVPKINDEQ